MARIEEKKKREIKEVKNKKEVQELAMEVKNTIPALEEEESLEEKLKTKPEENKKKTKEKEDKILPIKNLEEELENVEVKENETTIYGALKKEDREYKKVEMIKGEGQFEKDSSKKIMYNEFTQMSDDMKNFNKNRDEDYITNPLMRKDKSLTGFKSLSEDYDKRKF